MRVQSSALDRGSQGQNARRITLKPRKTEPRPRGAGKLIWSDDFAQNAPQAVPGFGEEIMTFSHADGEGCINTGARGLLPVMYRKLPVKDFVAECDVRVPSATFDSGYGLIFRSDDRVDRLERFYAILVRPANGTVLLSCWKNSDWVLGKEYPVTNGLVQSNRTNRIRVEAVGTEFRTFINNSLVFEEKDPTLSDPGIIGLAVSASSANSETAYFGRLRIYEPLATAGLRPPAGKVADHARGPEQKGEMSGPGGLRVPANQGWTATGVHLTTGQIIDVMATGTIEAAGDAEPRPYYHRVPPGGREERMSQAPKPDSPGLALLGRIGPNGPPFFIGSEAHLRIDYEGGELFLGINDDAVSDNSGAWNVTIGLRRSEAPAIGSTTPCTLGAGQQFYASPFVTGPRAGWMGPQMMGGFRRGCH